jgi:hypothetical protein
LLLSIQKGNKPLTSLAIRSSPRCVAVAIVTCAYGSSTTVAIPIAGVARGAYPWAVARALAIRVDCAVIVAIGICEGARVAMWS